MKITEVTKKQFLKKLKEPERADILERFAKARKELKRDHNIRLGKVDLNTRAEDKKIYRARFVSSIPRDDLTTPNISGNNWKKEIRKVLSNKSMVIDNAIYDHFHDLEGADLESPMLNPAEGTISYVMYFF